MKPLFEEKLQKMSRKYYEVFGDLEATTEFFKLTSLILLVLMALTLAGAFLLAKRPPVVIRVTEAGEARAIEDLKRNNRYTKPEMLYFSRLFLKRFTEYNAYTLSRDLAESFSLMTSRFQKRVKENFLDSGFFAKVKDSGLNAALDFKEDRLEKETGEFAVASLIFVRSIASYKNPDFKDSGLYKAELVLKKVPRTIETPAGLLVEDYREFLLNSIEKT